MSNEHQPPAVQVVRLDEESIDRLAQQLAGHLTDRLAPPPAAPQPPPERAAERRLLTVSDVSRWWGVSRSWIYRNADRLGALRLGTGTKPRLRFDPANVTECLGERPAQPAPGRPAARRARHRPGCAGIRRDSPELLPIRTDPELLSVHDQTSWPGGADTPPATAPKKGPSAR